MRQQFRVVVSMLSFIVSTSHMYAVSQVERLSAELEQEKMVRKKTERDLADERGRATMLEMSWNKTVVQRDSLQEQLEQMQAEWDKTQAALTVKSRMYSDLEDRLVTSQRKVESLDHENKNLQASIDELEKRLVHEQETRIQVHACDA